MSYIAVSIQRWSGTSPAWSLPNVILLLDATIMNMQDEVAKLRRRTEELLAWPGSTS